MRTGIFNIDWWLLIPTAVLVILSFTVLFSIGPSLVKNQGIAVFISIAAFILISRIHYQQVKKMWIQMYLVSFILLVLVLVFGTASRGAIRWISLFGLQIQFSEVLKPFLLLCLAGFLSRDETRSIRTFFMTIIFLLPVAFLIYFQPDLGNAAVYVFITFLTLLIAGFPLLWFGLVIFPFLISAPFLWEILHDYQRQRLLTFLYPTRDPLGTSYNIVQAIIAVGSGAFLGKGLNEATQSGLKFLPERHTDFIFATISESLGFVGSSIIIICFVVILFRLITIYQGTEDLFDKLFACGAFLLIFTEGVVNIGMNLGILPVVGITLPFVSYGGSSLLAHFILLGLLTALQNTNRKSVILEIR